MKLNISPSITYKNIFIVLALLIAFLLPFLSFDYGITEDTKFHNDHGQRILNYFKGIEKSAAYSPIDENGNYINISDSKEHLVRGMNGFGGFFDLTSNFLYQFFPSVGRYEFNNMINAIFGFLLFLFCGLVGRELGGWKAAVLIVLFIVLTPVLFGHSMNNPKDIPAAAFYMFCLFQIVKLIKELPVISLKRSFFLILNISLLINIRIIGLIVLGYPILAVFVWWFIQNYVSKFKKVETRAFIVLMSKAAGISILSYLAVSVFWPYAHTNPIKVPLEVLFKFKEFNGFVSTQLFEGEWRNSFNMPWYYVFKTLFIIQMPLHIMAGMILLPLLYFKQEKEKKILYSIVLFTTLFPLLIVLFSNVNSYSNSRQFLFIVPPVIVLSAISCIRLFDLIVNVKIKSIVYLVLFFLMLEPVRFMISNHPLQSSYYSPVVGGVRGAYGNYEIDYWGFAVKPAINWLKNNVANEYSVDAPARVRMYYGAESKASYYLGKIPGLKYVSARRNSQNWDYSIVMLTEGKYKKNIDVNWSKENTVHEIKVDGVPICFIIKNKYDADSNIAILEGELTKNPSTSQYIQLALLYHKKGNYFKSIEVLNKLILVDPNNSLAYNNLCSAYNNLFMYEMAKKSCEKSLAIAPDFQLAKNNLKDSNQGLERQKNTILDENEYVTLSYNHYKAKDYKGCIAISNKLLTVYPNNEIAYNNICSSYNMIGEYKKGLKACEKALEINPNFELAKNNLNWAKQELKN